MLKSIDAEMDIAINYENLIVIQLKIKRYKLNGMGCPSG